MYCCVKEVLPDDVLCQLAVSQTKKGHVAHRHWARP